VTIFKRNSKIIPYISKYCFQLNLTLGRVGKGHSDEEEITEMEELKVSQNMKAVCTDFDNRAHGHLKSHNIKQ